MGKFSLISLQQISRQWFLMRLLPSRSISPVPGQFMHIRLPGNSELLLRRPFSIHYLDPVDGSIWILIQVVGRGSAMLTELTPGETLDCLGPLGKGFELFPGDKEVVLVSGGVGMAPLYFLASVLQKEGIPFLFLLGVAARNELPPTNYFFQVGIEPVIAIEDGSSGYRGMVTDLFSETITKREKYRKPDRIFACGPPEMLSATVKKAADFNIPIQVSLEAPMACGVGACLGCVCRIRAPGRFDEIEHQRVCKEGPVFPGELVVFHEP